MTELATPATTVEPRRPSPRLIGANLDARHLAVQPIEADVLEQWRLAVDAHDEQRVAQLVQFAHALRDVGKPLLGESG